MNTFPLHILEAGRQHHLSLYTSSVIHADPIDIYYCLSARISVPLYLVFRYLTSTRPNPEHKSVMWIDLLYVIGSKRLSTAATIASDEICPGQHRPKVGIEIFVLVHFTDRTLTKCTLASARHTEEKNTE